MRKTFQMMIAAGALGLPMVAAAGPDHDHDSKADCPADCVSACCVDLAELVEFKFETPDLFLGDDAPKMEIAQFVKGESLDAFEEGKVYVVEFWATWCGPCVKAFPHISELQKEYGDKVQVVGVNIWDRAQDRDSGEFTESDGDWVQRISEFVDEQGDNMSYTVALQQDTSMQDNWMKAAGRNGIPSAFIVDGNGKIGWVGHPMSIDEPLAAAVKGELNLDDAIEDAKTEQLQNQAYKVFSQNMNSDDKEVAAKGYTIARAMVKQFASDDAGMLNAMAWPVLDPTSGIQHRDYEFALELGQKAAELTEFKDPMILDTYATALFKTGDIKGAIKNQKKAIKLIGDSEQFSNYLGEFEARLAEFEGEG